jgi:hypothetical protein
VRGRGDHASIVSFAKAIEQMIARKRVFFLFGTVELSGASANINKVLLDTRGQLKN